MGTGIKLNQKGLKFVQEKVLKAYYNPETREEIAKIAKVLEIDLEALKDSVLKRIFNPPSKKAKMKLITKCEDCGYCVSIILADAGHACFYLEGERKIDGKHIYDTKTIPDWCPLPDALEIE